MPTPKTFGIYDIDGAQIVSPREVYDTQRRSDRLAPSFHQWLISGVLQFRAYPTDCSNDQIQLPKRDIIVHLRNILPSGANDCGEVP